MPSQILNWGAGFYVGIGPGYMGQPYRQGELQGRYYGVDTNYPDNRRVPRQYYRPHWPGGGTLLGESQPLLIAPEEHAQRDLATGGNATLGFHGITRDASNAPIGGVTVRLFRTGDGALVHMVVSADDGSYAVTTPYQGEDHFITCHKSGSPDIAGASVSTLEPR